MRAACTREHFEARRRASSASLATVFLQSETPDGAAWVAWEHWARGGDGLVLWNDALLERSPAHRERLATTVARIREVQARLGEIRARLPSFGRPPRTFTDAAIVHDADSIAAGWLRDALLDGPTWPRRRASHQREHGTRERKVRSWLRCLEDAGLEVGSLQLRDLAGGAPELLVLPELLVVDERDVRELEAYLDRGDGWLVIDGSLGWIDRDGRPWRKDVAARLRARAPERVLAPPSGLGTYLETRRDAAARAPLRAFLAPVLAERPLVSSLVTSSSAPALVLTRRQTMGCFFGSEPVLVCVLPNHPSAEERRALAPVELELAPPEGYRIEWLYPREPGPVPAGDAAVLLVTPER